MVNAEPAFLTYNFDRVFGESNILYNTLASAYFSQSGDVDTPFSCQRAPAVSTNVSNFLTMEIRFSCADQVYSPGLFDCRLRIITVLDNRLTKSGTTQLTLSNASVDFLTIVPVAGAEYPMYTLTA